MSERFTIERRPGGARRCSDTLTGVSFTWVPGKYTGEELKAYADELANDLEVNGRKAEALRLMASELAAGGLL